MEAAYSLAGQPTWGTMIYAGAVAEDAAEQVRAAIGAVSYTHLDVYKRQYYNSVCCLVG